MMMTVRKQSGPSSSFALEIPVSGNIRLGVIQSMCVSLIDKWCRHGGSY